MKKNKFCILGLLLGVLCVTGAVIYLSFVPIDRSYSNSSFVGGYSPIPILLLVLGLAFFLMAIGLRAGGDDEKNTTRGSTLSSPDELLSPPHEPLSPMGSQVVVCAPAIFRRGK